jgi:hypothetical protein
LVEKLFLAKAVHPLQTKSIQQLKIADNTSQITARLSFSYSGVAEGHSFRM